jgi:hypothetical protein
MVREGKRFAAPRFVWQALAGKHWQAISGSFEPTAVTEAHAGDRGSCPAGMVHVRGQMRLDPPGKTLERLQLDACTRWLNQDFPERCRSFDRHAWLARTAGLSTRSIRFCIDRFEYPSVKGQYPAVFVNAREAAALCADQGKRLCDEDEWTFACEGEEAAPYSQAGPSPQAGYERDAGSCIADVEWTAPNEPALADRGGGGAALEMDRLWRGKRSGEQSRCKSAFGVHDMVGNVDEWTTASRAGSTASRAGGARVVLKGGYWGPVRARCRPSTRFARREPRLFPAGVSLLRRRRSGRGVAAQIVGQRARHREHAAGDDLLVVLVVDLEVHRRPDLGRTQRRHRRAAREHAHAALQPARERGVAVDPHARPLALDRHADAVEHVVLGVLGDVDEASAALSALVYHRGEAASGAGAGPSSPTLARASCLRGRDDGTIGPWRTVRVAPGIAEKTRRALPRCAACRPSRSGRSISSRCATAGGRGSSRWPMS